jgi:hypothetical protein
LVFKIKAFNYFFKSFRHFHPPCFHQEVCLNLFLAA